MGASATRMWCCGDGGGASRRRWLTACGNPPGGVERRTVDGRVDDRTARKHMKRVCRGVVRRLRTDADAGGEFAVSDALSALCQRWPSRADEVVCTLFGQGFGSDHDDALVRGALRWASRDNPWRPTLALTDRTRDAALLRELVVDALNGGERSISDGGGGGARRRRTAAVGCCKPASGRAVVLLMERLGSACFGDVIDSGRRDVAVLLLAHERLRADVQDWLLDLLEIEGDAGARLMTETLRFMSLEPHGVGAIVRFATSLDPLDFKL